MVQFQIDGMDTIELSLERRGQIACYLIFSDFSTISDEIWSFDFNGLHTREKNKLILFYT